MACIVVVEGPVKGKTLALESHRLVMIGRDDQCTFQILDEKISRRHLQIKRNDAGNGHSAIDWESKNGVYVNDSRITKETPLGDGDVIRIGGTSMVYTSSDSPDAQKIGELFRKKGEWGHDTILGE